jgi:hypothetical protein
VRWALATVGVAAVMACLGLAAVFAWDVGRGGAEEPVAMPESPMPGRLLVGFQDDASLRWAPDRSQMLDRARDAGASVIRSTVAWFTTAPTRPAQPESPFDPAYRFDDVDDLVRSAQQRGVELLLTIWGTPPWANGGERPNRPPTDPHDLELFAQAVADRYSGRHSGYPAVRLFSAWNEPNLEQFLSPQFDEAGRSVGPSLYAPLARAIYDGIKRANGEALVAIGETSPRGHDAPSRGRVQDSHSPPRFARLLAEERPRVRFDAWAQHPYPLRADVAPTAPVRWPRVGLSNLERFGTAIDTWFERDETPIWVTEYAHETLPDLFGIVPELQAAYAGEAVELAASNPRVRMFLWFILRDSPGTPWESGLLSEDGSPKPSFARFGQAARRLDARNPVLPGDAEVARVPALEIAYHTPSGSPIDVKVEGERPVSVPLGLDGWLEIPLANPRPGAIQMRATDAHGRSVERVVRFD